MSKYDAKEIKQLAAMFQALSNPHRLVIFMRLLACCEPGTCAEINDVMSVRVGELGKDLDIVPSTLSHHIKELRRAGLIEMERRGQSVECWIEPETLEMLADFFGDPLGD